jgi:hypothetical protein
MFSMPLALPRLCLLVCWLLLNVRTAWALPRLQYSVAEGCPERAWFSERLVEQQTPEHVGGVLRVEIQPQAEDPPRFPPMLTAELRYSSLDTPQTAPAASPPPSTDAPLQAHKSNGATAGEDDAAHWDRQLQGEDCQELLNVLALSFAVYLESSGDVELEPPALLDEPLPPPVEPAWVSILDYEASARWRLGLIAGLNLRGGLAPGVTAAWGAGLHLRGVHAGWAGGPFELGFAQMVGPRRASAPSAALPRLYWDQHYWTVYVLATPWTMSPYDGLRVGPSVALHGGRFGATVPNRPITDVKEEWFSYGELVVLAEMQRGGLLLRSQLGVQFPIDPYPFALDGQQVYHQGLGLVVGLGLGWTGVLL